MAAIIFRAPERPHTVRAHASDTRRRLAMGGARAMGILLTAALSMYATSICAAEFLDLAAHRGKVVLVDFWASWCEPCRHSFPWLNEMQAKYGNHLVVIGINVDPVRHDAERFLAQVPANFRIVYDPAGELASKYEVIGMPSSYVFDTSGKLVDKHIGFRKALRNEREVQLQKLFNPTPAPTSSH